MDDALRERVEALERAVTDGEHDLSAVADEADALDRLDELESQVTALDTQIEELQAATQALRGYVGNVRSVNTDVEQRADAALAKAESLEQRLGDGAVSQRSDTGVARSDSRRHSTPTQGDRNQIEETTAGSHDDSAVHGTNPSGTNPGDTHPTDGGVRTTETDHCASCGRPHDPEESTSTAREDGLSTPTDRRERDDSWSTQPEVGADTPSTESVGGVEGVPTVESLARGSADTDDLGGESLPSGDADPLVGATDRSGEAGTLQRIRDLL